MNLTGNWFDFVLAFLSGIAISFTPCVYPLVPITIGVIGEEALARRSRGFLFSVLFVTGVALTYAGLGLAAVATGKYFGKLTAHPFFYFFIGASIIIFAFCMMDIIKMPARAMAAAPAKKRKGAFEVLLMGVISGFAVGPCTAPMLGSILTYAGTRQNYVHASLLLVCFAYGMGLLLILVGTFSGFVMGIPKPGAWMVWVKRILGLLLMAWGGYFIWQGYGRMQ